MATWSLTIWPYGDGHREAYTRPFGHTITSLFDGIRKATTMMQGSGRMLSHLNPVRILPSYLISILILSLHVRSYMIHFRNQILYSPLIHKLERHSKSCRVHCSMKIELGWNGMAHGDAREGKSRGNWRMQWVASTLHTTSEHGVSSITTADAHTSAASSRLNWRPRRFKWTPPFRQKTKSGFCACAIIFQM